MEKLAQETDTESPCPEGSCYEVSVEGAIGYCPGVQYLTRWLFYPAMDEKSITEFVEDVYSKLEEIKAEETAEQHAPATAAKFCPNCGTPYEEDAKFCIKCGTPRK